MFHHVRRPVLIAAGFLCLAIAAIGIVAPVLPTTPFVLLAAWCFARGSERLHRRLLADQTFGPLIHDWEEHRVIPLRAKVLATSMMVPMVALMVFGTEAAAWAKALAVALVIAGLAFIWSKSSRPDRELETDTSDGRSTSPS